jgi:cation-dependent mannose-6-phosphate receptor
MLLIYKDGDACGGDNSQHRTTLFSFLCDKSAAEDQPPQLLAALNDCSYVFEWRTPYACATTIVRDGQTSWFRILVYLLLIGGSAYVLGGVLFKRLVLNKQGFEQIPHIDFWRQIVDYVKDMGIIVLARFFNRPSTNRVYRHVQPDHEDDDNGRVFLEDDEDDVDEYNDMPHPNDRV